MMSVLDYRNYDSEIHCKNQCDCTWMTHYLLTYQLPEDIVVQPNLERQTIVPSAKNRYLRSVIVEPVVAELDVTASSSVQVFSNGPYSTVTVRPST